MGVVVSFEQRFTDAVAAIYDAAESSETWGQALGKISDLTGAIGSHFMLWNSAQQAVTFAALSERLDPAAHIDYAQNYVTVDPNRLRSEQVAPGRIYSCIDHYGDDFARKSAYHNDFLGRYGLRYISGTRVAASGDSLAYICLNRSRDQGPFVASDNRLTAMLLPHIQRAASLHLRLVEAEVMGQSMVRMLDSLASAAFVADGRGRVLHHNRAAEALLMQNDGLTLARGCLAAATPRETQGLMQRIHQAASVALRRSAQLEGTMRLDRPSGQAPLAVQVTPLSPGSVIGGLMVEPLALVQVTDLSRAPRGPSGRTLVELFGLSHGEAQLALRLFEGRRLEDIAEERGVKITTLRTQLSAILAKTGTERQPDLLLLLARLPPG